MFRLFLFSLSRSFVLVFIPPSHAFSFLLFTLLPLHLSLSLTPTFLTASCLDLLVILSLFSEVDLTCCVSRTFLHGPAPYYRLIKVGGGGGKHNTRETRIMRLRDDRWVMWCTVGFVCLQSILVQILDRIDIIRGPFDLWENIIACPCFPWNSLYQLCFEGYREQVYE